MSGEHTLPMEAFYFLPFFLGFIVGGICGVFLPYLRVWHGLVLGVCMGPPTAIITFAIAIVDWINTRSDDLSTGAYWWLIFVMICVAPATWAFCFLVNQMREELYE